MESSWNMDKNEWYRVGEDIRDQVQRAVETSDFAGLGKTIGDTVNRAVGDVGQNLNRTVETVSYTHLTLPTIGG